MSFPSRNLIDKKHIQDANKTNLSELMRRDGFELEENGLRSYFVSSRGQELGIVCKGTGNSQWEWITADTTRNSIQYVQYVHSLNFPDAVQFLDRLKPEELAK